MRAKLSHDGFIEAINRKLFLLEVSILRNKLFFIVTPYLENLIYNLLWLPPVTNTLTFSVFWSCNSSTWTFSISNLAAASPRHW